MHNFIFKKVSSKEEMDKSYAIRKIGFCEEQKISEEIEFDNLDHLCSHFLIFDKKKAIATARVRQNAENIFKIERVAVLIEFTVYKSGLIVTLITFHPRTQPGHVAHVRHVMRRLGSGGEVVFSLFLLALWCCDG